MFPPIEAKGVPVARAEELAHCVGCGAVAMTAQAELVGYEEDARMFLFCCSGECLGAYIERVHDRCEPMGATEGDMTVISLVGRQRC